MGRPRELTQDQRAELAARGFERVELWVSDRKSPAYLEAVAREMAAIAEADAQDEDIDEWIVHVRGNLWDDETT